MARIPASTPNPFSLSNNDWIFQAMAENIDEVFWISEPSTGRMLYVSPAFERLWALSAHELLSTPERVNEVIPANVRPSVQRYRNSHHKRRVPYHIEYPIQPVNGLTQWVHERGYTLTHPNTGEILMTGVVSDITERKQMELQLLRERNRARMYLDAAAVMMIALDADGKIRMINPRGLELLGAAEEDLIGRHWVDCCVPARLRDTQRSLLQQHLSGDGFLDEEDEYPILTAGGEERWISWRFALLYEDGGIDGMLLSGADQTETRRMQAQLNQADRLSSMGTLAAGIAHEINNPLTYVTANLDMLRHDLDDLIAAMDTMRNLLPPELDDTRLRDALGDRDAVLDTDFRDDLTGQLIDILEGVMRIRAINHGLGMLARVEGHKLDWINVNHPLDAAALICFNEIKYRARLVKQLAELPQIYASAGRLAHVFLNLILDAARAIETGHADDNEIVLTSEQKDDRIVVTIRDTGRGMDVKELSEVFTADSTSPGRSTTGGAGLVIARDIVQSFGGNLTLESNLGRGTTAIVELPLARADSPPEETHGSADGLALPPSRILIIDDDPSMRAMLKRSLGGHQLQAVPDGRAGIEVLKRGDPFDLILCDLMMAHVTGMDVHDWVRNHRPELVSRLVFMTGGGFTPEALGFVSRDDVQLLRKPFTAEELHSRLAHTLNASGGPLP